ncbi:type I-E CRISPR-associated protein Cse2/CasB [Saccharomonospora viridis]|jgi:CRISPR system Cascade subunit CasB|uniref:CRISPR-associated protein, Cse2 family n=1 Tax=Saccharomonospora viridis (strain ATCC 15386 / DSM 43017 / JCM 3036 / CCUG 5913 / NBRC 12207 / NCIMB 9602 / P101) TaxID=471857 RepID=C7MQD4_SACVD|nr:type I-E CRISPR-associated protein Cse2/CasB [Saccharomonospora viridis]ACU96433.1 CRISPR-associated protein, Cse2 family [Saccharomonospora viridis DSM 43017]
MTSPTAKFVQHIVDRCDDLGVRADLRSGVAIPIDRAPRMHAHVARWTRDDYPYETAARYTVAALIAYKPEGAIPDESPGNLGASLALATHLVADTRERLLHMVTSQPPSRMPVTVARVVAQLRDGEIPVDFVRLCDDLNAWPWRRRDITRRWMQSYYRHTIPTNDDNE